MALFNPLYISQTHQPTQLAARLAVRFEPFASPDLLFCDYLLPLPSLPSLGNPFIHAVGISGEIPVWIAHPTPSTFPPGLGYARESHPYLPTRSVPFHPIPSPLLPSFPSRLFSLLFNITNTTVILRTVPTYPALSQPALGAALALVHPQPCCQPP